MTTSASGFALVVPLVVTRDGPTLSAVLAELGYTHHPLASAIVQGREVRRGVAKVWDGPWDACWAWLTKTGQIAWPDGVPVCVRALLEREAG